MTRILLIKLTSLGDLIHALPALTDAREADPTIEFDWVVDEHFQEVAKWHPAVNRVFTTNHRAWRGALGMPATYRSIVQLVRSLRSQHYDLIIDGQGNFKTALLALCSGHQRAGFDRHSVREWIAHLAYQKQVAAPKTAHAIDRLRRLFAGTLGYARPLSLPRFQIRKELLLPPPVDLPSEYLVFVTNASWKTKLWPESHWAELIRLAIDAGYHIVLPWGNSQEEARARRLAGHPQVHVLPKLTLSEVGYVLQHARGCVCTDTGLSHLAAALDIPSVTLYGATDSGLIGASGGGQEHIQSTMHCAPCNKKTCRYSSGDNPCLLQITPERVFHKLTAIGCALERKSSG